MGDAVTFADPKRPEAGLRFAGRIAEQFKLVTGTWVSAGTLRAQLVAACAPWVRDVVICGINERLYRSVDLAEPLCLHAVGRGC